MNSNAGAKYCKGGVASHCFLVLPNNPRGVTTCRLAVESYWTQVFAYSPTAILAEASCCDRRIRSKRAPSSRAFQLASIILLETPTVDQLLPLSVHCASTRTLAAVLLRESSTRTL